MRLLLVLFLLFLCAEVAGGSPCGDTTRLPAIPGCKITGDETVVRPFQPGKASDRTILLQNQPNPASSYTDIYFYLIQAGPVSLKLYNTAGREIGYFAIPDNGYCMAGYWYDVHFPVNALSSGEYYYRMWSRNYTAVKKMIILK